MMQKTEHGCSGHSHPPGEFRTGCSFLLLFKQLFLVLRKYLHLRHIPLFTPQVLSFLLSTVSGSVSSKERKLSGVLDKMRPGDSLIVTEISRLSRTLLEIMTILNSCIKKGVILYSTKEGYVFQNDNNSKVLGFAFGLMAEIERNLISMRTKEALERRRKEGKHLGRKKGDTPKMKILYANKRKLVREHQRGESCAELARQMGVSRTTMFRFLRRY